MCCVWLQLLLHSLVPLREDTVILTLLFTGTDLLIPLHGQTEITLISAAQSDMDDVLQYPPQLSAQTSEDDIHLQASDIEV